jgi:NADPH-dependent 2,4-dienoyl-CoA reductase/sulfur reductase-like enzyme
VESWSFTQLLHQALDLGVAQLHLGLALELGLGNLDADDPNQAFADIIARRQNFTLGMLLGNVVVYGAGEGGLEAGEVGAALASVDIVGKTENASIVGFGPAQAIST